MTRRTTEHDERFGGHYRIWQENAGPGWELVPGKLTETLAGDG